MLYVMLAYLMLFAALSNAVCLYNDFFSFWPLIFVFMPCLGLLIRSLFISVLFCIMHNVLNLFPNSMFTPFFI